MSKPGLLGVESLAVHGTALLLWGLALWHSWIARGLFADGSAELLYMMQNGGYALFYDSRQTLLAVTQAPAAAALHLGVLDTALLARLLSAGLFFVPTAYYHACLWRARHDPVLLGAVLLAIAVVFLPTSFFIVGEYNTISPAILFAMLVVATARRPTLGDAALLIGTAAMLLRSYETMIFYGPLVACFIAWMLRSQWQSAAGLAHLIAALLFLASGGCAVQSLLCPADSSHIKESLWGIALFWTNLQFVLPLSAVVLVTLAALLAPGLLERRHFYMAVAPLLVAVALCPLLWLAEGTMRPFPKAHYHSRLVASVIVATIAVAIWLHAAGARWAPRAFALLSRPGNGRRWVMFGLAAVLASVPADAVLSELWRHSLVVFQSVIARPGASPGELIAVETTPLSREPWRHFVEDWALSSESVVLRRALGDGIVLAPAGFVGWQFFDGRHPTSAAGGRFLWRDGI